VFAAAGWVAVGPHLPAVVVALVVAVEAAAAVTSNDSSGIARSEFPGVSSLLNRQPGLTLAGGFLMERKPVRGRSCQESPPHL
jgi:hypothetical protein